MAEGGDTGLPASFEMAWGVRERPTKGPKRGLSLEQIVDAGVRVAGADGLGAVSMSRVAGELGTSAMSLYRYVASKDELLALMVDAALGDLPDRPLDQAWRAGLEWWARTELAAYRAHPWVLRVPVSSAPITPNTLIFLDRGLQCLGDTLLEEGEKMSVILLLTSFTRSWAMLSFDIVSAIADGTSAHVNLHYGEIVSKLITREGFPALAKVLDAGVFDDPEQSTEVEFLEHDFDFGLATLLDGVEVLVNARES
jgi:AcrR family transcriptional regulator